MEPSYEVGGATPDRRAVDCREGLLVERRLLVSHLETLTPDQWDEPTLCDGWRVREVVAHLTYSRSNTLLGLPTWLRHRSDIDRAFSLYAHQRAKAGDRVLLRRYRDAVESDYRPPRVTPEVLWCDSVVHGIDIRRPRGLRYPGTTKTLAAVAESLATMTWPSRHACRSAGLRLAATDVDWSIGSGPEVIGPIEDVLLAIAGRHSSDLALTGDGLALLAQRP
jgi:uncharacterized protein (TIGR03083 family)